MPQIGEIKRGKLIGKVDYGHKYIWQACMNCGKERWVRIDNGNPASIVCRSCIPARLGDKVGSWKGGRRRAGSYIGIKVYPDNFFYRMANCDGYVMEHRLVMAKHLGRCLLSWEIVHHKNGIRDDNRLENLELLPLSRYHVVDSQIKADNTRLHYRVDQLEKRVAILEAENVLLRESIGVLENE